MHTAPSADDDRGSRTSGKLRTELRTRLAAGLQRAGGASAQWSLMSVAGEDRQARIVSLLHGECEFVCPSLPPPQASNPSGHLPDELVGPLSAGQAGTSQANWCRSRHAQGKPKGEGDGRTRLKPSDGCLPPLCTREPFLSIR
jgi:hypothetical protein